MTTPRRDPEPVRAPRSPPGRFAVLRRRQFVLLWLGQLVSTAGTGLTTIAGALLVFRDTGSAAQVGLLMIVAAAPGLLVGPLAGVVGDRGDRARTMIRADVGCAAVVMLIPVLVPLGLPWLFVLIAASSALAQFFAPAQAGLMPETVPDDELAAANALMTVSQFGALALGYGAAGLLTQAGSLTTAFVLNGVTFLLSAACVRWADLPPPSPEGPAVSSTVPEQTAALVTSLREGFAVVRRITVLRSLAIVFVPVFLCYAMANALALTFAVRTLGASELEYSGLEIAFSAGFVASSLALAGLADRLHPGQWLTLGIGSMALAGAAFATVQSVPLAVLLSLVMGLTNAPPFVGRTLLVQRWAPGDARARVSSLFFVVRDAAGLLGMALAGLADLIDIRLLLLINSAVLLGCAVATATLPGLRSTGHEWNRLRALLRAPTEPLPGAVRPVRAADLDLLGTVAPAFADLDQQQRRQILADCQVVDAEPGTAVVQLGDPGTAAFVVLRGCAVATLPGHGNPRILEVHDPGDVFGEIAALSGVPRTATVVAQEATCLLRVPVKPLRSLLADTRLRPALVGRVRERLGRTAVSDLPRFPTSAWAVLAPIDLPGSAPDPLTHIRPFPG